MGSSWYQTIGLVAVLWLATSGTIARLIPVPTPALDPAPLRAAIPDLVLDAGRPDFLATLAARHAAELADPRNPLGPLLAATGRQGWSESAWRRLAGDDGVRLRGLTVVEAPGP